LFGVIKNLQHFSPPTAHEPYLCTDVTLFDYLFYAYNFLLFVYEMFSGG